MIIYTSSSIWNPNIEIGPTWVKIEGKFLLGATTGGSTGTDINSNASVDLNGSGGEASHIITTEEMASHDHGQAGNDGGFAIRSTAGAITIDTVWGSCFKNGNGSKTYGLAQHSNTYDMHKFGFHIAHTHSAVGSNSAHNNMPPFRAVYIWEKTA